VRRGAAVHHHWLRQKARTLYVDRAVEQCGLQRRLRRGSTAKMSPIDGLIRLHILLDRSSVEVFGNDGRIVFSEQLFPAGDSLGLELFIDGQSVKLNALDIWQLEPATFQIENPL
jgi:fructan beta-fructosidase